MLIDYQLQKNMEINAGRHSGPCGLHLTTFCGRDAVAATRCSKAVIVYLTAFLISACGLGVSDQEI